MEPRRAPADYLEPILDRNIRALLQPRLERVLQGIERVERESGEGTH